MSQIVKRRKKWKGMIFMNLIMMKGRNIDSSTPLWKHVTKIRGKVGGTTKFMCLHCKSINTCSYTFVAKHPCGIMPYDEGKTIGVRTCD